MTASEMLIWRADRRVEIAMCPPVAPALCWPCTGAFAPKNGRLLTDSMLEPLVSSNERMPTRMARLFASWSWNACYLGDPRGDNSSQLLRGGWETI